jgi:PAS domain S-box-containing protein
MMPALYSRRASQLRHALRVPLNQILGYADMLLDDLDSDAPAAARTTLQNVLESGRIILEITQNELTQESTEITPDHVIRLGNRIREPLGSMAAGFGRLQDSGLARQAGLEDVDVLHIAAAIAELSEFTEGKQDVSTKSEPEGAGGRVLIVDDSASNRDLLTRMLSQNGFVTTAVGDGPSALAEASIQRFDIILLDMKMPGMDGLAVLERLKSSPAQKLTPVIMISAHDETTLVTRSLQGGAEDYVRKPFDLVILLARIRSTLERSRLRANESLRAQEVEAAYRKLSENERRLHESEERLRFATEAAEVGIWYLHASQDSVTMTGGCRRLFGLPLDEESFTFADLGNCIHPEDRERVRQEMLNAISAGSEYESEYRVVWPDDSIHWLAARGLAQSLPEGDEMRLAGVALDVTTRRRAEEVLRQTQKLESIGLLAGGIAHDFNNLLTGIIGSATFVLDSMPEDYPFADMLRNVVSSGERAASLTRQLLAYAGKGKFSVRPVCVSTLVEEILALLRASIPRSIRLECDLQAGLPRIDADASQIQQTVMNLVMNGAEAIEGSGLIRVVTGVAAVRAGGRQRFVLGDDIAPGDYVYLEVTDNGCGMDRETVKRIFEPFFTTKFTGRGLGLAAVFGIIRSHDGALEVRTTHGSGSKFKAYFPLSTRPV